MLDNSIFPNNSYIRKTHYRELNSLLIKSYLQKKYNVSVRQDICYKLAFIMDIKYLMKVYDDYYNKYSFINTFKKIELLSEKISLLEIFVIDDLNNNNYRLDENYKWLLENIFSLDDLDAMQIKYDSLQLKHQSNILKEEIRDLSYSSKIELILKIIDITTHAKKYLLILYKKSNAKSGRIITYLNYLNYAQSIFIRRFV